MSTVSQHCPFCHISNDRRLVETQVGFAFYDSYPVSEGHALVVPYRHVLNLFDLNAEELAETWRLVAEVRQFLNDRFRPAGFTVGVNDGVAAGQTVPHAHIHVIPRRLGDVADPRGGIRWVLPGKAAYWEKTT